MGLGLTRVGSAKEAAALLAADSSARFLAGGTLLMRAVNRDEGAIGRLIVAEGDDLRRIDIVGRRVTLGAAVTMSQVAAHPELGFLEPVAASIGGPAVRNMATVGGNLFARAPYGDFAVALLALGATVTVDRDTGSDSVDLETFLTGRGRKAPAIVRSIAFDSPRLGAFRFAKVIRRKPHGVALLAIAALLPVAGGRLAGVRVAYGGMAPAPMRARTVENALEGKALDVRTIADASKVANEGCAPADDAFGSAWYRTAVLPVHLRRLLEGKA